MDRRWNKGQKKGVKSEVSGPQAASAASEKHLSAVTCFLEESASRQTRIFYFRVEALQCKTPDQMLPSCNHHLLSLTKPPLQSQPL